jgi:N-acetylmuramoyl-L-alanine amidase
LAPALHLGDSGAAVVELHERLSALGYRSTDVLGTFGERTVAVVEAFQRSKGLRITGEIDDFTWQRLLEAGWRLGDRLLFLATPHLRGDDVADLQMQLAQLGFNSGHIDGIFGVQTQHALEEFQRNCGVEVSGTLTSATMVELARLGATREPRRLVTEARDVAGFDYRPGPVVLCGDGELVRAISDQLSPAVADVVVVPATENPAAFANAHHAALVLSLETHEAPGIRLHYWVGYRSHSRRGEMLASAIAAELAQQPHVPPVEITGLALAVLRETLMPTLHIELDLARTGQREVAEAIATVIGQVIHR